MEGPVEFLKLPAGYSGGNAVAVSPDGRLIAGNSARPRARRRQPGSGVARWYPGDSG